MTPESCFIRVGSSIQSMSNEMINNEFSKRTRNSLKNIVSPKTKSSNRTIMIDNLLIEEFKKKIQKNLI